MARHVEHSHQSALISWSKIKSVGQDGTTIHDYLFAIPNGGKRNPREASRLKAQGVKKGVSDLMLALPSAGFSGLWIELKAPKTKKYKPAPTPDQSAWLERMNAVGYRAELCYGWQEAKEVIEEYLAVN